MEYWGIFPKDGQGLDVCRRRRTHLKESPSRIRRNGGRLLVFLALATTWLFLCPLQAADPKFFGDGISGSDAAQEKIFALYGFDRQHDWFRDKTDSEILGFLQAGKVNAVFGVSGEPELAALLRGAGIRIYAEFGVFVGEKYWREIPGSRPVGPDGRELQKIDWYAGLNPANESIRRRKLAEFRELLEAGNLDGVWLDFIRWPGRWEESSPQFLETSFDRETLLKFALDIDIEGLPADNPEAAAAMIEESFQAEWIDWRCRQVTSWVEEARKLVDQVAPTTRLGLFAVPWADDHGNAVETVLGQDFKSLGKYIDVFSPMAYHMMCGRPVSWIGDVSVWLRETTGREIVPIIQTVDQPEALSPAGLAEAVREAYGFQGSKGVILFNLSGLDKAKLEAAAGAIAE